MSYLPQLRTPNHGLSSTSSSAAVALTPDVTSATTTTNTTGNNTSAFRWDSLTSQPTRRRGRGSRLETSDDDDDDGRGGGEEERGRAAGKEEEVTEEEVWNHYMRMTEDGVRPTRAPCPSPISSSVAFHLPEIRQDYLQSTSSSQRRKSRHHKNASAVLRELDPRVRFFVTAANASERVTSGKAFARAGTPVWNRALLGRGHSATATSATAVAGEDPGDPNSGCYINGNSVAAAARTDRGSDAGKVVDAEKRASATKDGLTLDVTKISSPYFVQENNTLSPYAVSLIKDHAPGMDLAIAQQQRASPILVDQNPDPGGRPRGGSSKYGSASRRMGLSEEPPGFDIEAGEDPQAAHPFLRMYQTRPGAFARLLSREPDSKLAKVAPGSTIASLMAPHPALAADRQSGEELDDDEFDDCVKGTTISMKNKKKRKKHRPRYVLPSLRHFAMSGDWPRRRYPRSGRHGHRNNNNNNTNHTRSSSSTRGERDSDGSGSGNGQPAGRRAVPKAALHTLSVFPKQFVLSSREDDAALALDRSLSDTEVSDYLYGGDFGSAGRDEEQRLWDRELHSFSDMDYTLPGHLEELLRQEGVDGQVVDTTVAHGKVWHDRALYLSYMYHIKRRKFLARPSRYSSLPPINKNKITLPPEVPTTPSASDVEARRERRENRSRPWERPPDMGPDLPKSQFRTDVVLTKPKEEISLEKKARDELEQFRTEADIITWEAEMREEVASLPPDFVHPRLVIISSKVPRCYSMSKAIRKGDTSILYIVYDFDTCSFAELLDTCKQQLEQYQSGCKAKSALFMCQGAEGCLYMFRKIVLTPQKMKRVQYQQIKEFWKSLGELMSKVDHTETAIHLLGGSLDNTQGKLLVYEIQKASLPNLVNVSAVDENTDAGREVIEQYFNFRKFILWRAKNDSSNSLDYTDITRSWTSLADEADEMDTR